jgi:hypothetical protein
LQGRNILLFLAILVLGVGAANLLVAPIPPQGEEEPPEDEGSELVEPLPSFRADDTLRIELGARATPALETVDRGRHVVLTISAPEPGEVAIEDLGLTASVGPGTPATFDLFTDRRGRFVVTYEPVDGAPRRVGTLVVEGGEPEPAGRRAPRGAGTYAFPV